MVNGNDIFYTPAFPVERVLDPTGAGDSFAGGFMGYLAGTGDLSPENIRRAALVGTVSASVCVEGFGTQALRECSKDALKERYNTLVRMTSCPTLDR